MLMLWLGLGYILVVTSASYVYMSIASYVCMSVTNCAVCTPASYLRMWIFRFSTGDILSFQNLMMLMFTILIASHIQH